MADQRNLWYHKQWLGLLQPTGLVVTPPALDRFGLVPRGEPLQDWHLFRDLTRQPKAHAGDDERYRISDFPRLARELLEWRSEDLREKPFAAKFTYFLEAYNEVLAPDYLLMDFANPGSALLSIQIAPDGADLDRAPAEKQAHRWPASPMARFDRLLRETKVPAGLLCNADLVRLVYAPNGETTGYLDFPVAEMATVAGREILAAFIMLLHERLVSLPANEHRLRALLDESRKYQNEVSEKLALQVQKALVELLRGFQQADSYLLDRDRTGNDKAHLYGGLLTVLMRLVFILYAEDQGLMPDHTVYAGSYSLSGLFAKLREDAARYPDTMNSRHGAWPQLLSLFRLIFAGGAHGDLRLTARYGELFNPDSYPFLEGRARHTTRCAGEPLTPPRVADGTVHNLLENLLILDGERLSYRALDVEQIGSVYEAMMGFEIEAAAGPSQALGKFGVVVATTGLLAAKPKDRAALLQAETGLQLGRKALDALGEARTPGDLEDPLQRYRSPRYPDPIPAGGLFLQPGEERRKTGSHYTPRQLTEPIVRHTLDPVFARLGPNPSPAAILDLKICDPAMGSGAFLVEACRYLADRLVIAWDRHPQTQPAMPPDEDRLTHARRLVAGRCLYGVDKNPFAVGLAKLSLWLFTLARDQPFTFLDHALRCGDSLLGLTRDQISLFTWLPQSNELPLFDMGRDLDAVVADRRAIHELGDGNLARKRDLFRDAEAHLDGPRLAGDLVLAAFFSQAKARGRENARIRYRDLLDDYRNGRRERAEIEGLLAELREPPFAQHPFHWELEFPEVFQRTNRGFDAFVGNPPFAGMVTIIGGCGDRYHKWLLNSHDHVHGNGDLVAHFFRQVFDLLRQGGSMGLIATNSISQGDTRYTGLQPICERGGTIYRADRRFKWVGTAAVIVSLIHITKGSLDGPVILDGKSRERITAFLFHSGTNEPPQRLEENSSSFNGVKIYGPGFQFEGHIDNQKTSSIETMNTLIKRAPRNGERIFPYIGGAEVNSSPTHQFHRYVINFGEMSEAEARQWPDLMAIVEEKVKPRRQTDNRLNYREKWWQFAEYRPGLFEAIKNLDRVLVISEVSAHLAFAFISPDWIPAHTLKIFVFDQYAAFAVLQSRIHEVWARFFGSSLEDRLRYTPTDCFETFPFPPDWAEHAALEQAGRAYYEFRAGLMVAHGEGMTQTYNRFHDPDESDADILRLRELHAAMDAAVLAAYGWTDLAPVHEFLLDYEDGEDAEDKGSRRKKPWRYRWPDELHDEVLARLLALNAVRAAAQAKAPRPAPGAADAAAKPRRSRPKAATRDQIALPGMAAADPDTSREEPS